MATKKKTAPKKATPKKAAPAKLLADAGKPMSTGEMIEVMSPKGLWKSPSGKTPDRTLYSAIL